MYNALDDCNVCSTFHNAQLRPHDLSLKPRVFTAVLLVLVDFYTLNNIGSLEGALQYLLGLHGNGTEGFFLKNRYCLECSGKFIRLIC